MSYKTNTADPVDSACNIEISLDITGRHPRSLSITANLVNGQFLDIIITAARFPV